jgi:hypothetical protein
MALKDLLAEPPKTRHGFKSKDDTWREGLNEADRAAFDAAVRNPEWTHAALRRVIASEGCDIGLKGFRDWRLARLEAA